MIDTLIEEYNGLAIELDDMTEKVAKSLLEYEVGVAKKIVEKGGVLSDDDIVAIDINFKKESHKEEFGLNDLVRAMVSFTKKELDIYTRINSLTPEDQLVFWNKVLERKYFNNLHDSINSMLAMVQAKVKYDELMKAEKEKDIPKISEAPYIVDKDFHDPSVN